jgi:flagellar hook-associated protein 2
MSFTPLTFSGISSYSQDFQTVLDRAVKIASLPLKALQNENTDLLTRKTQLASIGGQVSNFASALESLGTVSKQKGLQVTSSNSAVVSVSNTNAEAATTYTINNVTSLAKAASETSATGYADSSSAQVSASGTVKLTVGTQDYTINLSPANNNLNGLRNAINALGSGVTASILTTGTGATPNYLTVSANAAGATTLRLVEDPNGTPVELLTSTNQGSNAVFQLNGVPVSRNSNQVNDVIPGLSFNLLAESSTPVTLTIATQKSRLTDSLEQFVSAYNSLQNSVAQQVGPSAGLLSGDFLVREIQKASREVTNFAGDLSLSDLGIRLGKGRLVFRNQAERGVRVPGHRHDRIRRTLEAFL